MSSMSFLNVTDKPPTWKFKWNYRLTNLLHVMYIYLNVCKQMIDVKLLLVHSSARDSLTVCKQTIKSKLNDSYRMKIREII